MQALSPEGCLPPASLSSDTLLCALLSLPFSGDVSTDLRQGHGSSLSLPTRSPRPSPFLLPCSDPSISLDSWGFRPSTFLLLRPSVCMPACSCVRSAVLPAPGRVSRSPLPSPSTDSALPASPSRTPMPPLSFQTALPCLWLTVQCLLGARQAVLATRMGVNGLRCAALCLAGWEPAV